MASATIGNPAEHAGRIIGRPVSALPKVELPAGPRDVLVYNPPVVNEELGLRANYQNCCSLNGGLGEGGCANIGFGHSRTGVEVMLKYLRDALADHPIDERSIMAYRGGYLPARRRRLKPPSGRAKSSALSPQMPLNSVSILDVSMPLFVLGIRAVSLQCGNVSAGQGVARKDHWPCS